MSSTEVTPQSPGVDTNTEPDKIIIYNKGRSTSYEKGTEANKALKDYIYKMISEKAENNQLMLAIVNGDVSELKKELTIEFLYTQPVEFRYPNGSKKMITKFLIASRSNLNSYTIITAPATPPDNGLYAGGVYQGSLFEIRANPSNDELILKYAMTKQYSGIMKIIMIFLAVVLLTINLYAIINTSTSFAAHTISNILFIAFFSLIGIKELRDKDKSGFFYLAFVFIMLMMSL